MSTGLVLRVDVIHAQLRTLLLLEQAATPGPWGLGGSSITAAPELARDPDDVGYYGGAMVCESIGSADALFVIAARNLMPDCAAALDTVFGEVRELRSRLARTERLLAELSNEIVTSAGRFDEAAYAKMRRYEIVDDAEERPA